MSIKLSRKQRAAIERARRQFQSPGHYTAKDRDQIPAEDFGDPQNKKYPIVTQQDVHDAAALIGKAANPDAVKARIKAIAKRKGFALPDAWQDEEAKEPERMATPQLAADITDTPPSDDSLALLAEAEAVTRAIAAENGYEVTITRKAKAAPPPADEEDDEPKDEEEENDEEPEDEEEEGEPERAASPDDLRALFDQASHVAADLGAELGLRVTVAPVAEPVTRSASVTEFPSPAVSELLYIPITRIDHEKREVEGVLSNEEVDTFGTIFDYDSMKRAVLERWHGNVREQHDSKKAAGRRVRVITDDDKREVIVRSFVSTGAEDTWRKLCEGILTGYSIGAANAKTETRMVDGKPVPVYKDFDLAEISYVDAPSNPGAKRSGLTIYRAAGFGVDADEYSADLAEDTAADADAPPTAATIADAPVTEAPPVATVTPDAAPVAADLAPTEERAQAPTLMRDTWPLGQEVSLLPMPAIDHAELESRMNAERGGYHLHSHPYTDGMVHENDAPHTHTDGVEHQHRHMHAHAGEGDGAAPHVHLHDHGHQYLGRADVPASDMERTATGDYRQRADTFIGQDDPRVAAYLTPPTETTSTAVIERTETAAPVASATTNAAPAPAEASRVQEPDETRYGKTISADTSSALHQACDQLLRTCGCNRCKMLLMVIDPDQDGDDDTDADLDTDGDMTERVQVAKLTRQVEGIVHTELQRAFAPHLAQLRGLTARLAGVPTPDLTRVVASLEETRAASAAALSLLERMAAEEKQGGPVLRGDIPGLTRAPDKAITSMSAPRDLTEQDVRVLEKVARQGLISQQDQASVATHLIAQQNGLR